MPGERAKNGPGKRSRKGMTKQRASARATWRCRMMVFATWVYQRGVICNALLEFSDRIGSDKAGQRSNQQIAAIGALSGRRRFHHGVGSIGQRRWRGQHS